MKSTLERIKLTTRGAVVSLPLHISRWLLLAQEYRRIPHLTRPTTFNEKINWRILYDRNPLLVTASSKVLSKQYVASLGTTVIVPRTIWHGSNLDEIIGQQIEDDWVLKPSHKSGSVFFGTAGPFSRPAGAPTDSEFLRDSEWDENRLWGYHIAPKEMLLEERIGAPGVDLSDFKFFVFRGDVRMIQVDYDRHAFHTRTLYDQDWNVLPYSYTRPAAGPHSRPERFDEMMQIASVLGSALDFIRVDLYQQPQGVYFGELTAYPAAGLSHWPYGLDKLLGDAWEIDFHASYVVSRAGKLGSQ